MREAWHLFKVPRFSPPPAPRAARLAIQRLGFSPAGLARPPTHCDLLSVIRVTSDQVENVEAAVGRCGCRPRRRGDCHYRRVRRKPEGDITLQKITESMGQSKTWQKLGKSSVALAQSRSLLDAF